MNTKSQSFLLFLIGLFSQTQIQVVGSIGISELVIFLIAPVIWVREYGVFRREKVTTVLNLLLLAMVGCVISCLANKTPLPAALRGFAAPYGFFAGVVVFYVILRRSPMSFKWYLLGVAISFVVCTFYFQQAVEVSMAERAGYGDSAEKIMEGSIYWIGRLSGFIMWPIQGMYLQCPYLYSVLATFIFGVWAMISSASGRSAALIALVSSAVILIGGKTHRSMMRVQKWFILLLIGGATLVFIFKSVYTVAAGSGALGEKAQAKLEAQTRGGKDMLSLLMGGRLPVFIGAYACIKNPIWGYGPWAVDKDGITDDFLRRYGNAADYEQFVQEDVYYQKLGMARQHLLSGHSAIIGWWLWYGILGLPVWVYVLRLMYDTVRFRIATVPEFFGFFATMLPTYLWGMFFSPFGGRMAWAFVVSMLLLNRMIDEQNKQTAITSFTGRYT